MRECYAELHRDPLVCPIADWRDAFFPDPQCRRRRPGKVGGLAGMARLSAASPRLARRSDRHPEPFSPCAVISRARSCFCAPMLFSTRTREMEPASTDLDPWDQPPEAAPPISVQTLIERASRLVQLGDAVHGRGPERSARPHRRRVAHAAGSPRSAGDLLDRDRGGPSCANGWRPWLNATSMFAASGRSSIWCSPSWSAPCWFRLLTDPRGLSVLDVYDCRDFLRMNGGLGAVVEFGVRARPLRSRSRLRRRRSGPAGHRRGGKGSGTSCGCSSPTAGRSSGRCARGMGDCVFAPFYETLKRRGVRFEFFHRLENVRLASPDKTASGQRPYVEALEFDVQAEIVGGGEYQPLIDVKGVPCWPSSPDFAQLTDGAGLEQEGRRVRVTLGQAQGRNQNLERDAGFRFRRARSQRRRDSVRVQGDRRARDARWRQMVANVKTVATQSFQVWMNEENVDTWLDRGAAHAVGLHQAVSTPGPT